MRPFLYGTIAVENTAATRSRLTLRNPEAIAAARLGRPATFDDIKGFRALPDGRLAVPVGTIDAYNMIPLERATFCPIAIDDRNLSPLTLRPYQATAVSAALANDRGVIVMPPGAGKTITALAIIRSRRLRPLILVHTKDLMEQWINACRVHLGATLTSLGGQRNTKADLNPIGTVAMIQYLVTLTPAAVATIAEQHGMLIVDEAHHVPAATVFQLCWVLPGTYRYALTATPKREDGLTDVLHWAFGRILHKVELSDMEQASVAVRPAVTRINTRFFFPIKYAVRISRPGCRPWAKRFKTVDWLGIVGAIRSGCTAVISGLTVDEADALNRRATAEGFDCGKVVDPTSLAACYRALCEDPVRLALVVQLTLDLVAEGRKVLVLASRVAYAERITQDLIARDCVALCLTGRQRQKERTAGIERMRTDNASVIVSTTLADEGLDIPQLSGLVLAFPGRSEAKLTQRFGRLMRYVPGKPDPIVLDLVDSDIALFERQWLTRRRAYRKAGCLFKGR